MQPNSDKQDFNKQNNNNNSEGVYPSYQEAPPLYSPYSQQATVGTGYTGSSRLFISQASLHQQKGIVTVPVNRRSLNNRASIPITTSLKIFLCLSGFIYSLWGTLAFSFQLALVVNSYSTYYLGFWTGPFLMIGGILMMVIGFRPSYPLSILIRMYGAIVGFCTFAAVFSIINYTISNQCVSVSTWYCDDSLAGKLKISLIVIFSLALIHTIFNIIYISKEQKRALSTSNSNVLNY